MLRWRLLLGTLLIAALAALVWLDRAGPGWGLLALGVGLAILAGDELLSLAAATGRQTAAWPVHVGNALIVAAAFGPLVVPAAFPADATLAAPLAALAAATLLVVAAAMARYQGPGDNLAQLSLAVFALVYVGLMLAFAVQLRMLWGVGALLSLVIVVKMSDTGAYTVGRLIGRHKMSPILSPGKTLEGAAGALAFALAGSWATFALLTPHATTVATGPGLAWGWIPFGLLVGAAGIFGDLAESLIKRDAGRKDSSHWMPGFGGVLDVLDSILLAAPVAWACWYLGLVGRGTG